MPTQKLKPIRWNPKKRKLFTVDDINRLCSAAVESGRNGQMLSDYIRLMSCSGSRRDETLRINLTAHFTCSQEVIRHMKKQKSGSIINITSINAELGFPRNPSYVASKGGLRMLTKSMALDYRKYQIRVNSVSPGYILTDMTINSYKNKKKYKERSNRTILQRWGKTTDIVGVIKFLISQDSSYITCLLYTSPSPRD